MTIKLKDPQIIRATYRIVTPMFIGDAQQKATDISPASVKGALRFWWRALNWGRIFIENKSNETEALKKLHEEEAILFGSAAYEGKNKQRKKDQKDLIGGSRFTLHVNHDRLLITKSGEVHKKFSENVAARYLGYGVMEAFGSTVKNTNPGQLTRCCINEKQEFSVEVVFKGEVDESIVKSLKIMGLLGGLGSRARKGFGAINLVKLEQNHKSIWDDIEEKDDYKNRILSLLLEDSKKEVTFPGFSAFSCNSRIDVLMSSDDPYSTLNQYAKEMLLYRSWGRNGKVLGQEREERFKNDHDWSKDKKDSSFDDFHPERVIFGLPHNYGKGENNAVTPEKPRKPKKAWHERRASPLFFHIQKIGSEYVGISMLLPSKFLPNNEKINAGGVNVNAKPNWAVLTDFLDGEDKNKRIRFDQRESLLSGEAL